MSAEYKSRTSKVFTLAISVLVIGLLVVAGPVQGFSLQFSLGDRTPTHGDTIKFTALIDIGNNENLPIDLLTLKLSGTEDVTCEFDKEGTLLSTCEGITITKISESQFGFGYGYNFGYGYGFGQGELRYEIELDTSFYGIGNYDTQIDVEIGGTTFTKLGQDLTIRRRGSSGGNRACRTDWQCSSWSQCSNGQQTRSCSKIVSNCRVIEDSPDLIRSCGVSQDEYKWLINLNKGTTNPEITAATLSQLESNSNPYTVVIVLLVLNSIITALNISVRVNQLNSSTKKKRTPVRRK